MLNGGRLVALSVPALVACLAACDAPQRATDGMLVFQVANAAGPGAPDRAATPLRGEMEVGQRLEVRLGASAGTGYAWQLAGPAPAVMSLQSTDPAGAVAPAAGQAGTPGAGTVTTFAMTAVAAGTGEMRFVLARPWEKGVAPVRVVDIEVTVKPPPAR